MQRSASVFSRVGRSAGRMARHGHPSRRALRQFTAPAIAITAARKESNWALYGAAGAAVAMGLVWNQRERVHARSSEEPVMTEFPYVLIGTGPAVLAAAEKIRSTDPDGEILIVGEYRSIPYTRKALTTFLLGREDEISTIDRQPEEWFEENKIAYYPSTMIFNIDPMHQKIYLNENRIVSYDKCLIASGSRPRLPRCEIADNAPVSTFHTLADAERLRDVIQQKDKTVAVIGGSSWACTVSNIITSKYKKNNVKVVQVLGESGVLPELLPPYLSEYALGKHQGRSNLTVHSNLDVVRIDTDDAGTKAIIELQNGETLEVDHAVIISELAPNMSFSGSLETDARGFVANRDLMISSNLFTAGEAACHYDPGYGRRTLMGENHEVLSGAAAGENMVTEKVRPYATDIVEEYKVAGTKFNAIGRCDPALRTHSVWMRPLNEYANEEYTAEEYGRGIVYYLAPDDRVVGVVLWNMPDPDGKKEDRAISVIKSRRSFEGDTVKSAIVVSDADYFL